MKGRTYRFFQGEPLFPFGYGLSYTSFAYSRFSLPKDAKAGEPVRISVQVANTGTMAGEEVVQLYSKVVDGPKDSPIRSLVGFRRISLRPGERKTVRFEVSPKAFATIGADGRAIAKESVFDVSAGGKQPGFRGPQDARTTGVVTGRIQLYGTPKELD